MRISTKSISKCGVLICLAYVMWYKWVYGEQRVILYTSAAIAVSGMLLSLFFNKDVSVGKTFPFVCVKDIVMCAYSLIVGIFVASSQTVLMSTTFTYLAFSLVCLAAYYASLSHGFDWLLTGLIGIALLCAIWTLIQGYYRIGYGMVLGPENNPHTLGFVMNLGMFAVAYRSKRTTKSFVLNMLLITLFLYVIIQSGSRKCLLAAVFIILPWLWIELKSMYKLGTSAQKSIATALVLIIVLGGAYYFGNIYINSDSYIRMINIEESEANQARLSYFAFGFDLFLKSPLFGVGLGQFAVLNPSATYSHSVIPEALSSWGLLGSLIYFLPIIAICCRAFRLAKTNRDKSSIMIASLCAMELFMGFLMIYFYILEHMITWIIIALFVRYNDANRNAEVVG